MYLPAAKNVNVSLSFVDGNVVVFFVTILMLLDNLSNNMLVTPVHLMYPLYRVPQS